ncbi:MAG TPA: saccharopine dehydrogenase NADP-binding domain-containing protein, partial [Streptosporangiaceae bacterium]|nr:saccharopine dehydrogenase NADP-binding domain-containing protein [Streptosporangiaceae bacterium]
MPGRIVLYGATGYTGGLTARAMVVSGARPVLAGRDRGRLDAVAARLAQESGGPELETAIAGTEGPAPLRQLLDAGDVLVSTAGPFVKIGRAAAAAAVDAGAVYLDSTGEPPFIRQVFEEFGPRAERTGAVLLTAFGYD